jgi:hypothetical protein
MAQELERTKAGKPAVFETPLNGEPRKALDVNRTLGFNLAATAGLDKRVAELEEGQSRARRGIESAPWGRTVYPSRRAALEAASGVR